VGLLGVDAFAEEAAIHHLCLVAETDALDLAILNRTPAELAYAVIAQEVMLFQRDLAMRVEFEGDILSRLSDGLPR